MVDTIVGFVILHPPKTKRQQRDDRLQRNMISY
ncbi:hypothetical protein VPH184E373B_0236 [Vibrio phage 184E37-3b]